MTRADLVLIVATRAHLADGSAKRQRLTAGIRTGEMAAVLGVTPQAVSQWESGRRIPGAVHALAYARALAAIAAPPACNPLTHDRHADRALVGTLGT